MATYLVRWFRGLHIFSTSPDGVCDLCGGSCSKPRMVKTGRGLFCNDSHAAEYYNNTEW